MDIEQRKYYEKRICDICCKKITELETTLEETYKECLRDLVDTFIFKYAEQVKVTLQMFAEKSKEELITIMTDHKPIYAGATRPDCGFFSDGRKSYNTPFAKLINEIENVGMRSFKVELDPLFISFGKTYKDTLAEKKESLKICQKRLTDNVYSPLFDELNTYDFMTGAEANFDDIIKSSINVLKTESKQLRSTL